MIDLRSDTITKPSTGMRAAIANAPVGDDVYHDDPTVNELEETVADLLGKEAAMYVPTGTMSNQIAVRIQTEPGDTVVIESAAHVGSHELNGASHNSGVTLARLDGALGVFTADQLRDAVPVPHPALPAHLYEPYTLVSVENTHNEAGGTVWPLDQIEAVTALASTLGMRSHLDGARLWNASAASGIDVATYASYFDTVSVCFSKGLGAPIGSALVSDAASIARARRFKHMFGGGFRQAGLIAAGALYALEHNRERLAEDHANARLFAEAVAEVEGVTVDLDSVQTNIVCFDVADAGTVVDRCLEDGVALLALGRSRVRAVFHIDVSRDDAITSSEIVAKVVGS